MDKNQKSVENVGPSQSSSSRRVMWKGCDGEEEVYDSVVNYRSISPTNEAKNSSSSSSSEHELPGTSKTQALAVSDGQHRLLLKEQIPVQDATTKSSTSLAMRYKPSHKSLQEQATIKRARAIGCWHHIFDRIRNKKLGNQSHPSLALRYKPSHESLKNRRSKDKIAERSTSRLTNSSKPKLATADLKLETCFFPPYQTAVVREVAPKFANRMCLPYDTDSSCSSLAKFQISQLKSSKPKKLATTTDKLALPNTTSLFSHTEAKSNHVKPKNRTKATAGSSGTISKTAASGATNNAMPTLRQRQQELHRYRVQIEKRRLELLDLKIVRERADALRQEILFHKDLQLKHNQIRSYEDNNSSQA